MRCDHRDVLHAIKCAGRLPVQFRKVRPQRVERGQELSDAVRSLTWLAVLEAARRWLDLDALGRVFLTEADLGTSPEQLLQTHVTLDVQGNPLVVTDARGNDIQTQTFDMVGRPLYTDSADAGIQDRGKDE